MIAVRDADSVGRVLMVDDDAITRQMFVAVARKAGYDAIAVESVAAARDFLLTDGPWSFDCVVTDHQMPGESGLDLLYWVRDTEPMLSVVMMTGSTERETVTATLRGGAVGFLDKPVSSQELRRALAGAVAATRRSRGHAATQRSLRDIGRLQRQVMSLDATVASRLTVRFHPVNEAGGDFISSHVLPNGGVMVLAADVSGHDVRAAYTAAYFQGLVRGLLSEGRPIAHVMRQFHTLLLEEWGGVDADNPTSELDTMSVAACAVAVDVTGVYGQVTDAGAPAPWHVDPRGRLTNLDRGRSQPLGWFADSLPRSVEHEFAGGGSLLLWTDGLEDLANERGVPVLAMATAILRADAECSTTLLRGARDDVLVAMLALQPPSPLDDAPPLTGESWYPIFHDCVNGEQTAIIDEMQESWERGLALAASDISATRIIDILVVLREAVLNAMLHGCQGSRDRAATVHLSVRPVSRVIRAIIEDPGQGHGFDHEQHELAEGDDLVDFHRGISMIHQLSSAVSVERKGARLRLDFRF